MLAAPLLYPLPQATWLLQLCGSKVALPKEHDDPNVTLTVCLRVLHGWLQTGCVCWIVSAALTEAAWYCMHG